MLSTLTQGQKEHERPITKLGNITFKIRLQAFIYYVDSAGVVQTTATEIPIEYGPDGWQEISIAWDRDMTKSGLSRNFTLPLRFVRYGADILRELFYNQNI